MPRVSPVFKVTFTLLNVTKQKQKFEDQEPIRPNAKQHSEFMLWIFPRIGHRIDSAVLVPSTGDIYIYTYTLHYGYIYIYITTPHCRTCWALAAREFQDLVHQSSVSCFRIGLQKMDRRSLPTDGWFDRYRLGCDMMWPHVLQTSIRICFVNISRFDGD